MIRKPEITKNRLTPNHPQPVRAIYRICDPAAPVHIWRMIGKTVEGHYKENRDTSQNIDTRHVRGQERRCHLWFNARGNRVRPRRGGDLWNNDLRLHVRPFVLCVILG